MDDAEYTRRLDRIAEALMPLPERQAPQHAEPEHEPDWRPWQARQAERAAPAHVRRSGTTDAMIARQVEHVRDQLAQHVEADRRDKANLAGMLDALADESGATTGKLQRQITELRTLVAELQSQLNDTRGELALIRGLQPQKLMARKAIAQRQTIEGSLASHPVN